MTVGRQRVTVCLGMLSQLLGLWWLFPGPAVVSSPIQSVSLLGLVQPLVLRVVGRVEQTLAREQQQANAVVFESIDSVMFD